MTGTTTEMVLILVLMEYSLTNYNVVEFQGDEMS